MYPQIDKPFQCIDIYSRKPSVALWVHPFTCSRAFTEHITWTLYLIVKKPYLALREIRFLRTFTFWKDSHLGIVNVYDMSSLQYLSKSFAFSSKVTLPNIKKMSYKGDISIILTILQWLSLSFYFLSVLSTCLYRLGRISLVL